MVDVVMTQGWRRRPHIGERDLHPERCVGSLCLGHSRKEAKDQVGRGSHGGQARGQ